MPGRGTPRAPHPACVEQKLSAPLPQHTASKRSYGTALCSKECHLLEHIKGRAQLPPGHAPSLGAWHRCCHSRRCVVVRLPCWRSGDGPRWLEVHEASQNMSRVCSARPRAGARRWRGRAMCMPDPYYALGRLVRFHPARAIAAPLKRGGHAEGQARWTPRSSAGGSIG